MEALLKNKIILITGATQGIGAGIARHCVAHGAKVMLHGRSEERAQKLCSELGDDAGYHIAELTESSVGQILVDDVLNQFGRIDGVVNNAGIFPRNQIDEITEDDFEEIIHTNLRAPLFIIQAAVKAFRKQGGGGSVVNIGSINAHCGQTDLLIYSISKGGLMTLTRNLGDALSTEGIRINQLNVGWTMTENENKIKRSEGFPENWEAQIPKRYAPSGRLLRPEDIAEHVVFWLSEKSAPVSGQVYELEQYPVIGRNLINKLSLDVFKKND